MCGFWILGLFPLEKLIDISSEKSLLVIPPPLRRWMPVFQLLPVWDTMINFCRKVRIFVLEGSSFISKWHDREASFSEVLKADNESYADLSSNLYFCVERAWKALAFTQQSSFKDKTDYFHTHPLYLHVLIVQITGFIMRFYTYIQYNSTILNPLPHTLHLTLIAPFPLPPSPPSTFVYYSWLFFFIITITCVHTYKCVGWNNTVSAYKLTFLISCFIYDIQDQAVIRDMLFFPASPVMVKMASTFSDEGISVSV